MGALRSVIVNTRSLTARLTGVQRYTTELLTHFPLSIDKVSPTTPMQGMQGHLWEQFNLPLLLQRRLLWSPANSGPLIVKNQVVTIHDIAVIDHPEWFNARFAKWYKWITPTLVRRARFVIAVSEFTKRRLMDVAKVDGSRIIVIPNGVNPSFRRRPPDEIAAVRNKLGIPSAQYVLSLGTMEPRKNLAAQMTAWSRCVAELPPDIWLVVCGAIGKDHVFGDTRLPELPPRVHYTGYVPDEDLPALYSGAIAFLYPSFYEGFGLPVLEAMACGTVPVVSKATAPQEIAGDSGMVVDPYDPDSIAAAIKTIVGNAALCTQLSERAAERSQAFSWNRAADLTWQVLEQAMREGAAPSMSSPQ
jgi:glycosyltransferase involved in cell wall biosynthesis